MKPIRLLSLVGAIAAGAATIVVAGIASVQETPRLVETEGSSAEILYEAVIDGGHIPELTGKYKLRVTEIVIGAGGFVGDHNHLGPGIRLMTAGEMDYELPDETVVYREGDFFFEAGDVSHTAVTRGPAASKHWLFEILPADLDGPSLIPPRGTS